MPRLATIAWIVVAIALLLADGAKSGAPSPLDRRTLAAKVELLIEPPNGTLNS
jgi:hypothetical protein